MAEPTDPPPIVRKKPMSMEEELALQDAEDQRQLELYEAQEQTKQLRALFANRVYIQPDAKHLRISFGERVAGEDQYHTALVIPLEEALQIGDLIARMANSGLSTLLEEYRQAFAVQEDLKKPGNV